jgi:membrane protease YdiL (CAAX protease family)
MRTDTPPSAPLPDRAALHAGWGEALPTLPLWRVVSVALLAMLLALGISRLARLPPSWEQVSVSIGVYLVPLGLWSVIARRRGASLGDLMGARPAWRALGLAGLTTVAVIVVRLGFLALVTAFDLAPASWSIPDVERSAAAEAAWVPLVVLLGPLVEELVFRGILFRRLLRRTHPGVAALISSLLFGALHADPVGSGLFGLALVALYTQSRSLWVPLAAHALNNALFTLLGSVGPDWADPSPWLLLALEAVCLPWLGWFTWRGLRRQPSLRVPEG